MLHEPVFLGDFDLHEFYRQRTFDFLCAIIDQGAEKSKRCGQGLYIGQQINAITTTHSLSDKFIGYCGKHQNLIQGIRTISEAPRDFIRRLKHK